MAILLAGIPLSALRLTLPVSGTWTADAELQSDEPLLGQPVQLTSGGTTLAGYAMRGGISAGRQRVKLIGGTGGLLKTIAERWYNTTTAKTVLQDILSEAGETLDKSSQASGRLDHWMRPAERASLSVATVADRFGFVWRLRPSGAVWVGVDTYPASESDALLLDVDDRAGAVEFAPESIDLFPGVTWEGRKVTEVTYWITDGALRGRHYYDRSL